MQREVGEAGVTGHTQSSGLHQQKVMRSHQAFDRDFRAVPSEKPALPFEGTLHYSARAGRSRDERAETIEDTESSGPELFSAYMQKHLTSPGYLSISCRVHVCGAVEPSITGSLAPGAGLSVRRRTRAPESV